MAYYNEFFIEDNGKLIHVGSCTGSDTPGYFIDVKKLTQFYKQIEKLKKENNFWKHTDKYPFPWKTYKTSDNLFVIAKNNKKWFQFWKPTYKVLISENKYDVKDDNKCNFIDIKNSTIFGNVLHKENLITFDLPHI